MTKKIYTATKPFLTINAASFSFHFEKGMLELTDPAHIAAMEEWMHNAPWSSRSMVQEVDLDKALRIAAAHEAQLKQTVSQTVQGTMTAGARANQIQEVTATIIQTEAQHQNIELQNELPNETPNQLGVIAPSDTPNSPVAVIKTPGVRIGGVKIGK